MNQEQRFYDKELGGRLYRMRIHIWESEQDIKRSEASLEKAKARTVEEKERFIYFLDQHNKWRTSVGLSELRPDDLWGYGPK